MLKRISKARLAQLSKELRKEFASLGGKARAKKLKPKRRKEIAQMGGRAGGRGRKKVPAKKRAA